MVLSNDNPRLALADFLLIWNVYGMWVVCLLEEFPGEFGLGHGHSFNKFSFAMTMASVHPP